MKYANFTNQIFFLFIFFTTLSLKKFPFRLGFPHKDLISSWGEFVTI